MQTTFQALAEQITDYAIVLLDTEGVIRSWNAGARGITGYTAREALGRPLSTLLDTGLVDKAVKTGRAATECWLTRKSGDPLWTRNTVQLVTPAGGGTASLCWICQDPFDTET